MGSDRLVICGAYELSNYKNRHISHMVRITNPGAPVAQLDWFNGEQLVLCFGDVVSEADAAQFKTQPPSIEMIGRAVEFIIRAWQKGTARVLVHCDYGASRSPAISYVALAQKYGPGGESRAFREVLKIQPDAVPNNLVVHLGDALLERNGSLIEPLKEMHKELEAEVARCLL